MKYILILTLLLASTAFASSEFAETMAAAKQGSGGVFSVLILGE
jgi:hypothetical protein